MNAHPVLTDAERLECGLITLGCDHCRQAADMSPLHPERAAPNTWYYCPTCRCQWIPDRTWYHDRPDGRIHPVDAFFGVIWLVIIAAMMVGITYLVMADGLVRYGHDYLNNWHVFTEICVGYLCWLVLVAIGARVYSLILTGLAVAARAVWDAVRPVGSATR